MFKKLLFCLVIFFCNIKVLSFLFLSLHHCCKDWLVLDMNIFLAHRANLCEPINNQKVKKRNNKRIVE